MWRSLGECGFKDSIVGYYFGFRVFKIEYSLVGFNLGLSVGGGLIV